MTTVTTCLHCDQPATPETGPYCPRCEDDLCHLYQLVYGDLFFCGCGNPDDAYRLVRDLLALIPAPGDEWKSPRDAVAERIGVKDGDYGPWHIVLSLLNHADLIDHGTSIASTWLTLKGAHYLKIMQAHEEDDLDHVGFPHDGNGCPADCRHRKASDAA